MHVEAWSTMLEVFMLKYKSCFVLTKLQGVALPYKLYMDLSIDNYLLSLKKKSSENWWLIYYKDQFLNQIQHLFASCLEDQ